jgi:hypothetical protein
MHFGAVEETSTPPATNVRTRLSAPFIVPPLLRLSGSDQINHCSAFRQGLAGHYAASGMSRFLTGQNGAVSQLAACTGVLIWPVPTAMLVFTRKNNDRALGLWCAAAMAAGGRPRWAEL